MAPKTSNLCLSNIRWESPGINPVLTQLLLCASGESCQCLDYGCLYTSRSADPLPPLPPPCNRLTQHGLDGWCDFAGASTTGNRDRHQASQRLCGPEVLSMLSSQRSRAETGTGRDGTPLDGQGDLARCVQNCTPQDRLLIDL